MLRLGEILIVFGSLITLGASGYSLAKLEKTMRGLAAESARHGYISIAGFQHQLETGR